jgi:hypothetical protein
MTDLHLQVQIFHIGESSFDTRLGGGYQGAIDAKK